MLLPSLQVPRLGHIQKVFIGDPIYVQPPSNRSNQAWEDLFPKGKGYVSMQSIEAVGSVPDFVKDVYSDGSGHFCVALFHQLHCLYLIRNGFYEALDGTTTDRMGHALHCFEYLRQSILCAADTTLEPFRSRFEDSEGNGVDGMASLHQCRNFDQVYDWAERFRYNDDHGFEAFEG
ncbi:hypothetical protein MMC15_000658 [Xylographa vitiligo]|nr:hypothetical protein [Xylographa vitiligo]